MAGKIVVEMSGEEQALLRSLRTVVDEQNKIGTSAEQTARRSKKASDDQAAAARQNAMFLGNVRNQLMGLVGGYASVTGAVQLLTKAWQEQQKIAEGAANAAKARATGQRAVIKNIGDVSGEVAQKFISDIEKIAVAAKLPSAGPALEAAASVLSATSGNREQTKQILQTAAPFFAEKPEDLAAFGGVLGDVMGATGYSTRQASSYLLSLFSQARITELGDFKNIVSALAAGGVVSPGDKDLAARQSGALIAGVGGRIADPTGSMTGTAVANLMANLREAVPDLATTFERLQKVQSDPALQEQVLSKGFRGAIKPIIEDLVTAQDSQTSKAVMSAFEKLGAPERMVTEKRRQLMGLTPEIRATTMEAAALGAQEQYLTRSEEMMQRGLVGPQVRAAIGATSRGMLDMPRVWTDALMYHMQIAAGVPAGQAAQISLRAQMNQLEMDAKILEAVGLSGQASRESAEMLGRILAELRNHRPNSVHRAAAIAERSAQKE